MTYLTSCDEYPAAVCDLQSVPGVIVEVAVVLDTITAGGRPVEGLYSSLRHAALRGRSLHPAARLVDGRGVVLCCSLRRGLHAPAADHAALPVF